MKHTFLMVAFLAAQTFALGQTFRWNETPTTTTVTEAATYIQLASTGVNVPNLPNFYKVHEALENKCRTVKDNDGMHYIVLAVTAANAPATLQWVHSIGVTDAWINEKLAKQVPPELPFFTPGGKPLIPLDLPSDYDNTPAQDRFTWGQMRTLDNMERNKMLQDPSTSGVVRPALDAWANVPGGETRRITEQGMKGDTTGWVSIRLYAEESEEILVQGVALKPYRIQLGFFSSRPDRGPAVSGAKLFFHQQSVSPDGGIGSWYLLKDYDTEEEARAAAKAFTALGVPAFYQKALTNEGGLVAGYIP